MSATKPGETTKAKSKTSDVSPLPGKGAGGEGSVANLLYYGDVKLRELATDPNPEKKNKQKVKIQVVDVQSGDTIRTYTETPVYGMNRSSWNMRRDGISFPSRREPRPDADKPSGAEVGPGVYELVMTFGNHVGKTMVTVHPDPRQAPVTNLLAAREILQADFDTTVVRLADSWTELQQASKAIERVEGLLKDAPKAVKDTLTADIKDLKKAIATLEEIYTDEEDLKGIQRNPSNLQAMMFSASSYLRQVEGSTPTQMAEVTLAQFKEGAEKFIDKVKTFMGDDFAAFRDAVQAAELSLFGKL